MTRIQLAGPPGEAISLAEAKAYLKIEDEAEDGLVEALIVAARLHCEAVAGIALMSQSWRLVLDDLPGDGVIALPVTPFQSLSAITVFDEDGDPQELVTAGVLEGPDRLVVPRALFAGVKRRGRQGVEIDYVAGFGDEPEDVPAGLRQALMVLVGHWYENRTAVVVAGSGALVPLGFDALVAPFRRVRL
jgi:uncharacterized phiE125 gp8 family phage protein